MDISFDQASVLCQSNFSAKESLWQMTIQPKDFQRNYHLSIFESLNKCIFQKMCRLTSWNKPRWTQLSLQLQLQHFFYADKLWQTFRLMTPTVNTETFTRCYKFALSTSPNKPPPIPWPDWVPFSSLPTICEGKLMQVEVIIKLALLTCPNETPTCPQFPI